MSNIEVIIHREEGGGYWAEVPEMPGCFTDGRTLAEVRRNIVEATQCWMGMEMKLALQRSRVDSRPRKAPIASSRRRPALRRRESALA